MRYLRSLVSFLFGFVLITLAGVLLRASPVMAQTGAPQSWNDLAIARPAPTSRNERPRGATTPAQGDAGPMMIPASRGEARAPVTVAGATPRRRDQADGETEPPVSDAARDGAVETSEALSEPDGREAIIDDPRLPEDRAAFLAPPAGYDALAFQIELDPASDARAARLARFEPYAPVGRRAGSWVVFPTVEAGIGASSNVFRTSNARPDLIFDVRPTLLAVTDWQRHAIQFQATGLGSAYKTYATENDRAYGFEVRGRLDLSSQAKIEVLAAHNVDQELRSSTLAPTDSRTRTPYATDKVAIAVTQRFNRLSVQLRGAVTEADYQPATTLAGTTLANDERDLTQREVAVRVAWNFSPALSTFAELAGNQQSYRNAPADGIARDSRGDRTRVGLSFGNVSQVWRGEIALGYGRQIARDARLPDVEGALIDANLAWRPTPLTSVLLSARTDFLTSTTPGQGGATQRQAGLEVRHAFLRQLNGVAGVSYQVTDYQGLSLREQTTTGELGVEYFVSQSTTLLARYQHAVLTSTAASANTTSDTVRVGLRYRP